MYKCQGKYGMDLPLYPDGSIDCAHVPASGVVRISGLVNLYVHTDTYYEMLVWDADTERIPQIYYFSTVMKNNDMPSLALSSLTHWADTDVSFHYGGINDPGDGDPLVWYVTEYPDFLSYDNATETFSGRTPLEPTTSPPIYV